MSLSQDNHTKLDSFVKDVGKAFGLNEAQKNSFREAMNGHYAAGGPQPDNFLEASNSKLQFMKKTNQITPQLQRDAQQNPQAIASNGSIGTAGNNLRDYRQAKVFGNLQKIANDKKTPIVGRDFLKDGGIAVNIGGDIIHITPDEVRALDKRLQDTPELISNGKDVVQNYDKIVLANNDRTNNIQTFRDLNDEIKTRLDSPASKARKTQLMQGLEPNYKSEFARQEAKEEPIKAQGFINDVAKAYGLEDNHKLTFGNKLINNLEDLKKQGMSNAQINEHLDREREAFGNRDKNEDHNQKVRYSVNPEAASKELTDKMRADFESQRNDRQAKVYGNINAIVEAKGGIIVDNEMLKDGGMALVIEEGGVQKAIHLTPKEVRKEAERLQANPEHEAAGKIAVDNFYRGQPNPARDIHELKIREPGLDFDADSSKALKGTLINDLEQKHEPTRLTKKEKVGVQNLVEDATKAQQMLLEAQRDAKADIEKPSMKMPGGKMKAGLAVAAGLAVGIAAAAVVGPAGLILGAVIIGGAGAYAAKKTYDRYNEYSKEMKEYNKEVKAVEKPFQENRQNIQIDLESKLARMVVKKEGLTSEQKKELAGHIGKVQGKVEGKVGKEMEKIIDDNKDVINAIKKGKNAQTDKSNANNQKSSNASKGR